MAEAFLESIGLAELLPQEYQRGYTDGRNSMAGEYNRGYNAGYSAGLSAGGSTYSAISMPSLTQKSPTFAGQDTSYNYYYGESSLSFSPKYIVIAPKPTKSSLTITPRHPGCPYNNGGSISFTWPAYWPSVVSNVPSTLTSTTFSPLLSQGQSTGIYFRNTESPNFYGVVAIYLSGSRVYWYENVYYYYATAGQIASNLSLYAFK